MKVFIAVEMLFKEPYQFLADNLLHKIDSTGYSHLKTFCNLWIMDGICGLLLLLCIESLDCGFVAIYGVVCRLIVFCVEKFYCCYCVWNLWIVDLLQFMV